MRNMLEVARKAAETDHTTILIQGDSGTGKGVLARAIHYSSPRANQPLLELNCATLPDALLESELFGFEPGAFTDARRRKEGLLERAHGGTLFLDEIGNMSPSVQAKLLRVLEEGTFLRLGGTKCIKVDVRVVTATNTNLKEAVAQGRFREDPLLPAQCRAAVHSALAREKGRHLAAGTRHGAKIQRRTKEELYRIYGGSRRADHELSLAGEHPRIEERG
jgi:transcriptional regulator with GAF, ATPase, and Fis domain